MRQALRFALLCALAAPSALSAGKPHGISWGKTGISFEQYRGDAVECGRSGYYLDVADTEAAQVFRRATRVLEASEANATPSVDTYITSARIVEGTRPEYRMEDVRKLLQGTVDGCLIDRGYTPFQLSQAQRKQLGRLKMGSPERHAFLYKLATDPEVLSAQKVSFVLEDAPLQSASLKTGHKPN
jgi:hypothetical protein